MGLNFAPRAGQEHRNLRMKNFQLSVGIDDDRKHYLEYKEDVSKTNSGGLAHNHLKRKTVRAYESNDQPERCPVRLYKEYMAHVPKDAPQFHLFKAFKRARKKYLALQDSSRSRDVGQCRCSSHERR